ncbi:hypothetical protein CsSME_00023483 [Camellia sinensis var. sinensis]|uniref:UDP-glycosyltransferase n=1 Tax=Camellia sinensis TaxID=4442 RepID=A0A7J7GZ72_CAMSI|nr:hypothetical protein HYC85_016290 [Camellia sinensis]
MDNKAELVFMLTPGMGHIVSMVEFAKRLHDQDQRFSITFLHIKPFHPLSLDYRNELGGSGNRVELVAAEEIESAVRFVMDGEILVRKRVKEIRENRKEAVGEGGSSLGSLKRLVGDMLERPLIREKASQI